jgi:hypothetical protein
MRKKMTREGRLRKPHRREWPGLLKRLIPDQAWRELQGLAKKGMDPRTRWWAIEALRHGESCTQLLRRLRQAVADEYERRSSRHARYWPHKKTERPPRPPRLRRLSRTENARIERIFMNHTAQVA